MSVFTIPGPESSANSLISFGTALPDGNTYLVTLEWLQYEEYWILSWADVQGLAILAGLRVVANFNMFYAYSDPRLPKGSLIAHDTQNLKQPPGRNDWRDRHLLLFVPASEVVEECPVSALVGT